MGYTSCLGGLMDLFLCIVGVGLPPTSEQKSENVVIPLRSINIVKWRRMVVFAASRRGNLDTGRVPQRLADAIVLYKSFLVNCFLKNASMNAN